MEYSLRTFYNSSNFKSLTLNELINYLNLIGFEVDEINYQKNKTNQYLEDIDLLLKIPANRQDLLNEIYFQKELSTIFSLELNEIWKKLKINYLFLLNQKYIQYKIYEKYEIQTELKNLNIYSIELENVTKTISPIWIQNKLIANGISPKKDFRDLLLLVNLEWGQSIDLSSESIFSNKNFYVNKLEENQLINLPNSETIDLPKGTVVLKSLDHKIINVLGFNNFEIDESLKGTNNLTITAIFYNIYNDFLTLNSVPNRLSLRYLRRSFLENFRFSFQRLLTLIELITNSTILLKKHHLVEKQTDINSSRIITLQKNNLLKFLNTKEFDITIFKMANLEIICNTKDKFYIQVPNSRIDLLREIDLIEEYSRFFGYKNFKEILPIKEITYSKKRQENIKFIKNFFINHNFFEIITSSLTDISEKENIIQLVNPLNKELSVLRKQLIPNLLTIFLTNLKLDNKNTKFFEIGRTFQKINGKIIEKEKLAGIFDFPSKNKNLEWFEAKGFIELFLLKFGYDDLKLETLEIQSNIFHPKRSIAIKSKNKILGSFGELHPNIRKEFFIKERIYIFELNLTYFKNYKLQSSIILHSEISKYPSITQDLSFSISKEQNFYHIKQKIKNNSTLLKNISFFDIYFDEKMLNKINVGLRLEFQSKNETLTNEQIENEINKIRELLIQNFSVEF